MHVAASFFGKRPGLAEGPAAASAVMAAAVPIPVEVQLRAVGGGAAVAGPETAQLLLKIQQIEAMVREGPAAAWLLGPWPLGRLMDRTSTGSQRVHIGHRQQGLWFREICVPSQKSMGGGAVAPPPNGWPDPNTNPNPNFNPNPNPPVPSRLFVKRPLDHLRPRELSPLGPNPAHLP